LIAVLSVLVIAGSFGTWVSVAFLSVSGMDGDGKLSIVLGITSLLIGLIAFSYRRSWVTGLAMLLLMGAGAIGVYDWIHLERILSNSSTGNPLADALLKTASVGWGLEMVTIAGMGAPFAILIAEMMQNQRTGR
jgi:hypothetical protein